MKNKEMTSADVKEYLKELGADPSIAKNIIMFEPPDDGSSSLLREYGRPRSFTVSNHVQFYLRAWPDYPDPSVLFLNAEGTVPYAPICKELLENGWEIVWQNSNYRIHEMERQSAAIFINKGMPGYMIECSMDWTLPSKKRKKNYKKIVDYKIPNSLPPSPDYIMTEGDSVKVDDLTLFSPARNSPDWNQPFFDWINKLMGEHVTKKKQTEAEVRIIVVSNGDYDIRSFSLDDANTSFEQPDIHYGNGFEEFHTNLLERIDNESKGLVLFHGEPGTGKTQYIRHLLKELCDANKAVLYSPPSVSASLAEPQMINFISDWIMGEQRDCILLIEDAEPLLESRNGGADGRSTGISNLLNITDGILNDILGLMVIATFNIDINKIDSALLRPGRLVARKEFKKLDKQRAEALASTLGIELPEITYPATLAEFYNSGKAKNILIHNYTGENNNRIGFGFRQ